MPRTPSEYTTLFNSIVIAIRNSPNDSAESLCTIVKRSDTYIRSEYGKLHDITMNKYMPPGSAQLDRHKCGACFIVAFMRGLSINTGEKLEKYRALLAIMAGLTVVGIIIRGNAHHIGNSAIIGLLNANNGFKFPRVFYDEQQESFEKLWCIELRNTYEAELKLRNTHNQHAIEPVGGFSILSLANELLLVESYNQGLIGRG